MGKTQKSYHSNILTISGTGRNVGKTSLACRIIHKLGRDQRLTAIKISPHFHTVDYPMPLTEKPGAYSLYKEDRKDSGKDSSKMLAAGADQVFYIQTGDDHLNDAWKTGHSGVSPMIAQQAYRMGFNVMAYAFNQYLSFHYGEK